MQPDNRSKGYFEDLRISHAENDDVKSINSLITKNGGPMLLKATFGNYNLSSIIENSCLALLATETLVKEDGSKEVDAIAFLSVDNSTTAAPDGSLYMDTLEAISDHLPVSAINALFINMWLLDDKADALHNTGWQIIRNAFVLLSEVDFLLWLCPTTFLPNEFIEKNFSVVNPSDATETKSGAAHGSTLLRGLKVMFAHRSNFLPKLLVREARVEDNDDLIPILQKSNPETLVGQENYFLADLIQNQDERNRFFVGLQRNSVQGMLATSLDVNVSLIMKIFDTDHYTDIILSKEETPLPPPLIVTVAGDLRSVDLRTLSSAVKSYNCIFIDGQKLPKASSSTADESKNEGLTAADRPVPSPITTFIEATYSAELFRKLQTPAIVVFGYPRDEAEALEQMKNPVVPGYILELSNTSEDAEEDEEDEVLQLHLDALEVLRDPLGSAGREGAKSLAGRWKKVAIDSSETNSMEAVQIFCSELSALMADRERKIEHQRALDNAEPPSANAFAVTLFSLEEEFASRADDLLRLAFEEHPEHDYCLYMLPNNRPPSLLTAAFTYIRTRPGLSFDQSLYLMHRNHFVAKDRLQIERYQLDQHARLSEFLSSMPGEEKTQALATVAAAAQESGVALKDNPAEVCFVFRIRESVVGAAVVSRKMMTNEDITWIRANYNIDDLIDCERYRKNQGTLTLWTISPLYSRWTRYILREVMRMSGKALLYFQGPRDFTPSREILEDFLHLRPRRRAQVAPGGKPLPSVERPSGKKGGMESDCPLFCMNKKSLAKRKDVIAKRVVIVGGSSHAYAVLETLLSVPYLTLPNVYFVLDRLPSALQIAKSHLDAFALSEEESKFDDDYSGCLSTEDVEYPQERELYAMGFAHKVNLVRGTMTDIDRNNKAVVVSDEVVVEYDILVIATATQDNSVRKIASLADKHPSKCMDIGVFEIGNCSADLMALKWIRKRYSPKSEASIVIYGTALRCFTAAAKLIKLGIAPNKLAIVVAEYSTYLHEVEDQSIAEKIVENASSSGITIYWNHFVADVGTSRTGFIEKVNVTSIVGGDAMSASGSLNSAAHEQAPSVQVDCIALLCCNSKQCDRYVFSAVNDCGLVFDGGLVVDEAFQTVDPAVYAVSDYTKFSRTHKQSVPHARYSSGELGTYLAMKLLQKHLDPRAAGVPSSPAGANGSTMLPSFFCRKLYERNSWVDSTTFTRVYHKYPRTWSRW